MTKAQNTFIIGNNLRRLRLDKDFNQKQMCDILNLSQSKYSLIESNQKTVSLEQVEQYADALEVDIDKLLKDPTEYIFHSCNYSINGGVSNKLENKCDAEIIKALQSQLNLLQIQLDIKDQQIQQLLSLLEK
ncbi:MAG: helix-turn-helix domain-containing protein [Chitinophagales bacterium]|nr:helix-turn-helix domain-containing protein [Chitinophagales bacterium]HMU99316.1 helix-turn-helix transcriptional regulator [Chitinophagales bacterium]HMV03211.1 helix-turn-helix transcriptional regulator [Chitinophagales bacterium]HMW95472.1 helix-turn-helix transcriptional regulator [Chitinophagales bacterium]HMY43703.1 helix-turn-helix transcriptional regulator [Chitinophagales bacterium]